ncbi:MAG: hypothetical protein IAE94_00300, partial [Chthoniobacterales bacterium]|nr:hypothetical protein [Chthoniobacterales bacterium]
MSDVVRFYSDLLDATLGRVTAGMVRIVIPEPVGLHPEGVENPGDTFQAIRSEKVGSPRRFLYGFGVIFRQMR